MTPITFYPVANSANVMFVNFSNIEKKGSVRCLYLVCVRKNANGRPNRGEKDE
jgi:hypothetical protein